MPAERLLSRRTFAVAGGLAASLGAIQAFAQAARSEAGTKRRTMPVVFVGHGSPMNAIQDNSFTRGLRSWGTRLGRPTAILAVSAHWQTPDETLVLLHPKPPTIHDFGGFPRELHEMQYPAPGAVEAASRTLKLLEPMGARKSDQWGLDHGTWTVLHHMFPKADIPVFQLSIDYSRPGAFHVNVGRQLQALREEGVLILGSGNIVHNLGATDRGREESLQASRPWAQRFDDAVLLALTARDDKALADYRSLDASAGLAVPTPDHYWPMLYALGAAKASERPATTYASFQSGTLSMRCLQFG